MHHRTMFRKCRIVSFFLAFLLLLSASAVAITVLAVSIDQNVGIGKVTDVNSQKITDDLLYETSVVQDKNGRDHSLYSFEFNPKTCDLLPMAFSNASGSGEAVYDSAVKAEELGYDVKAAVNASFFGMSYPHTSSNTYGGVNISDGKILQGDNNFWEQEELVINSDGTVALVTSRVSYTIAAPDDAWSIPLGHVNICPTTAGETDYSIYYYDEFCGEKTHTKYAGIEVVFEKQNGAEFTVGGTLAGKVVEIRPGVSKGGNIGENQFVLYSKNSGYYVETLRSLSVGDTLLLRAEETIPASKTIMENCSSAFVTYGYNIVKNGVNVTRYDGLGEDFNTARAQRTAFGIKEDGSLLIVCSDGRKPETFPGLTVYELADYMIAQGCVTVINLDGGGSTQVTVENASGELETTFNTESRPVANSLLIVARPETDAEPLLTMIENASVLAKDAAYKGNKTLLNQAIAYADSVANAETSMPGDHTKAFMRLREAIDIRRVQELLRDLLAQASGARFSDYSEYALQQLREAYVAASAVSGGSEKTADELLAAYAALKIWYDSTGKITADGVTYEPVAGGVFLTGVNTAISAGASILYTPGSGILGQNLFGAHLLLFRLGGESYLLEKKAYGAEEDAVTASDAILGFDTVPDDCLLLAVHGDEGDGLDNKRTSEAMQIGQELILSGVDIEAQTLAIAAYFTVQGDLTIPVTGKIGDIDGNGEISADDYLLLKRAVLGTFQLTDEARACSDIDGDGKVDHIDYMLLKRAILGSYTIGDPNA